MEYAEASRNICRKQSAANDSRRKCKKKPKRLGPHRKAHESKGSHEVWILSYYQKSDTIKMLF